MEARTYPRRLYVELAPDVGQALVIVARANFRGTREEAQRLLAAAVRAEARRVARRPEPGS